MALETRVLAGSRQARCREHTSVGHNSAGIKKHSRRSGIVTLRRWCECRATTNPRYATTATVFALEIASRAV